MTQGGWKQQRMLVRQGSLACAHRQARAPFIDAKLKNNEFMALGIFLHAACEVSPCSQNKCAGSTEFSIGCNQLQSMIESLTIQRLPFSQTSKSQRGNKGLGSGPR